MKMKLLLVAIGAAAALSAAGDTPAAPKQFSVSTKHFAVNFLVGDDGRLFQQVIGSVDQNAKPLRTDESYPQAGDGYVWEPALQIIHSDGNTSTALIFENLTRK